MPPLSLSLSRRSLLRAGAFGAAYHCFVIDPIVEVRDPGGRPLPLNRGEVIRELF